MREPLGHAEGLGDRERAVRPPHRQPAGVARALGDELRRDGPAERAVQADERGIERRADVVDVAHEERAHAVPAVALEGARELERVREVAVARRVRRRRAVVAEEERAVGASVAATRAAARAARRVPATASASASCVAKLVISVTSTPKRVRSASLRSRKRQVVPVEDGRERLDLRAEARRHAACQHDGGDLAALDELAPERGRALAARACRARAAAAPRPRRAPRSAR